MKSLSIALSSFIITQASAVILQSPVNPTAGAATQVHFTSQASDPATWTLFLMNSSYVFGLYAILGTEIDPTPGVFDITLPTTLKPADDYILKAVKNDWVDFVIGVSPIFSISA